MDLMTHMIPYFPDREGSVGVVRGMIDGGARYIEIQFPFSDPTADGPAIQGASARALSNGFTIQSGWAFVADVISYVGDREVDVFVMSYASPVFVHGVDRFVAKAASLGVRGLIVPDLPIDYDEGLYAAGRVHSVAIVPVIALGASAERVALIKRTNSAFVYASLRRGTTGAYTEIGDENIAFLRSLRREGTKVVAGFGISSPEQVAAVLAYADATAIGSAFVRCAESAHREGGGDGGRSVYTAIREETCRLAGTRRG